MKRKKLLRKFIFNIVSIILLVIGFITITFALSKNLISVSDNLFKTGTIKINLNDGQTIIEEDGLYFEPGMTIVKEFFVENQSTFDVYYKIYFTDVSGGLSDILDVTIKNGDKTLYKGTINDLKREKVKAVDDVLKLNEKVILNISFHYPEDSGNNTKNSNIFFKLGVDAVQSKNNPNKDFD